MRQRIWTDEERKAAGQRLATARALKKAERESAPHDGNGELLDTEPTFVQVLTALRAISPEWIIANVKESNLFDFCVLLCDAGESANKRRELIRQRQTQPMCDGCHRPLPNGYFAGQLVVRDKITREPVPLRACSEGCYRTIEGIANERNMRGAGSRRGIVAM